MLGQLNREKPLDAITKEMIQEYQAEEGKPVIVDGEARKYEKASYEPQFSASFDELQPIKYYDERIQNINIKKSHIANKMAIVDKQIEDKNNEVLKLQHDIDTKGSNFDNLYKLRTEMGKIDTLKEDRKRLDGMMDKFNYTINFLDNEKKAVTKSNSMINQANKEEFEKI